VLTGDKVETAANVATACDLLSPDLQRLQIVQQSSLHDTREALQRGIDSLPPLTPEEAECARLMESGGRIRRWWRCLWREPPVHIAPFALVAFARLLRSAVVILALLVSLEASLLFATLLLPSC
jgi:magnesium-transporting ATPase (P-type)